MSSYPVVACRARFGRDDDRAAAGARRVTAEERRDLGGADRSALVIGGTEKIRAGGDELFVKVVAARRAGNMDGRSGEKRPGASRDAGPLEDKARPGVAGDRVAAPLGARFVKGERKRLLA